jgi:hypothetical protein
MFIADFACQLLYTTFFIILRSVMAFMSGLLAYCIGASKSYLGICLKTFVVYLTLAL